MTRHFFPIYVRESFASLSGIAKSSLDREEGGRISLGRDETRRGRESLENLCDGFPLSEWLREEEHEKDSPRRLWPRSLTVKGFGARNLLG